MKPLGDKCRRCGKRADPIKGTDAAKRWHHCPRCGITFNVDDMTIEEIRNQLPGKKLAAKFKKS